jgi:hypothetical protein
LLVKIIERKIINHINALFFDHIIDFFKQIIDKKMFGENLDSDWYKSNFVQDIQLTKEEIALNAGINMKTITNIKKTSSKNVVIDVARDNYDYLKDLVDKLDSFEDEFFITITLTYNSVSVNLNLSESLLVINALATKKTSNSWWSLEFNWQKCRKAINVKIIKISKCKTYKL